MIVLDLDYLEVKGYISMLMLSPTTQSSCYRRGFLFL